MSRKPLMCWVLFILAAATSRSSGGGDALGFGEVPSGYDPASVVATIDGQPLTLGDVLFRYASLPEEPRDFYERQGRVLEPFVADLVANLLVVRESEARDLEKDPLFDQLMRLKREEVLRDLYARRTLLDRFDDAALRARYEKERNRFVVKAEAEIGHILVTPLAEKACPNDSGDDAVGERQAKAKAERLRGEILAGKDFADVARRWSEDISARRGGDLGWVKLEDLEPVIAEVASKLPVGELSPVFRSPLGFHVIEVLHRRDGGVMPFELVRELLLQESIAESRADLLSRAGEERKRLEGRHAVQVFPDRLPW